MGVTGTMGVTGPSGTSGEMKYCPNCGSRYVLITNAVGVAGFGHGNCSRILFVGQTEPGCGWSGAEKEMLNEKQKKIFDRKKKLEKINGKLHTKT